MNDVLNKRKFFLNKYIEILFQGNTMNIKAQFTMVLIVILLTSVVQAMTASEVFEKASPSVVIIKTYDSFGKGQSLGSGVVLKDGVVVTNCHVVKGATTISVVRQGKEYSATLRHCDWNRDICNLNVVGLNGHAVAKGSTSRLKIGAKIYVIGSPKGLELTLSDGLISGLRPVSGGQYLQITAPISPGSSGGGLFDNEGHLIGLPTFYLTEGQQLNFAVPVEWINELPIRNTPLPEKKEKTSNEWFNLAIKLQDKKDWHGLIDHSLRWIKAQPKNAIASFILGNAYGEDGQKFKAIEAYHQTVRIDPDYASAWVNLGVVYNKMNHTIDAIKTYQQAIRINSRGIVASVAWHNIGRSYRKSKQLDKAIEAYKHALNINIDYANAWVGLGLAYQELKHTAKGIEAYKNALRINPEDSTTWRNMGRIYMVSAQIDKAIEAYHQAIRIDPDYAGAWYDLGVAYKYFGQTNQVMEVYKRLKNLDPELSAKFFNEIVFFN